ncbi:hypothetical protein CSV75_12550 [Sporosarcina sp. P18a]|nr:hypothetical protein CSV75_12550 [Sporosarcina sp. P18a]
MKNSTKGIILLSTLSFVMMAILITTQSYFNNKEIRLASEGCYEVDGIPELQGGFLNLNYSFSCQKNE